KSRLKPFLCYYQRIPTLLDRLRLVPEKLLPLLSPCLIKLMRALVAYKHLYSPRRVNLLTKFRQKLLNLPFTKRCAPFAFTVALLLANKLVTTKKQLRKF